MLGVRKELFHAFCVCRSSAACGRGGAFRLCLCAAARSALRRPLGPGPLRAVRPVDSGPLGVGPPAARGFAAQPGGSRTEPRHPEALVLALPKGRILAECGAVLDAAGIAPAPDYLDEDSRRLRFPTADPLLDVVRVRPFDVATIVAGGGAAFGICGGDVLAEFDDDELYAPLDLGIGACRISVAGAEGDDIGDLGRLSSVRVATKYPRVARRHFAARGVQADIVHLSGAMELAPGLGLARLIVDLVQTGSTLRANGLREIEVISHVTSRLIVNRTASKTRGEEVGTVVARFRAACRVPA